MAQRNNTLHRLTPEQRVEMVQRSIGGEEARKLASEYRVDRKTVFYHIHKQGYKTRSLHPSNFFKSWSPNMAYVLGLWFADGCMHPTSHCISFASKDPGF